MRNYLKKWNIYRTDVLHSWLDCQIAHDSSWAIVGEPTKARAYVIFYEEIGRASQWQVGSICSSADSWSLRPKLLHLRKIQINILARTGEFLTRLFEAC